MCNIGTRGEGVVKMAKQAEFWGEYAECVRREGIPEGQVRWYLRWTEGFARSLRGVPLKDRSIEDVTFFEGR